MYVNAWKSFELFAIYSEIVNSPNEPICKLNHLNEKKKFVAMPRFIFNGQNICGKLIQSLQIYFYRDKYEVKFEFIEAEKCRLYQIEMNRSNNDIKKGLKDFCVFIFKKTKC